MGIFGREELTWNIAWYIASVEIAYTFCNVDIITRVERKFENQNK